MRYALFFLLLIVAVAVKGQSYSDSIFRYEQQYIADLVAAGPIKHAQAKGVKFFKPDPDFRTWGVVKGTPGSEPFMIETHSGKKKPFREYGTVTFTIHDTSLVLHIYQSVDLIKNAAHKDDLFIPFTDETT